MPRLSFRPTPREPVKLQMFVPPLNQDYVSLNESFISNNYGVSVNHNEDNRRVTWSARRANGKQTLYYRLVMTKRYSGGENQSQRPYLSGKLAH